MTLNSIEFPFLFLMVFAVYYIPFVRKSAKMQNIWLLLVSYAFYSFTDWKMLFLLFGSTCLFFLLGRHLRKLMDGRHERKASAVTTLGVIIGISILLVFKYLDFFAASITGLLSSCGLNVSWTTLNIIVPVGVSFFTFKLIAYIVEIHRERIKPVDSFVDFAAYIAFFPTILSGPIDMPDKFIPQICKSRTLEYDLAVDGCRQILWGLLTKMCIADNLAALTDSAWNQLGQLPASYMLIAALVYPLQLYADFDGYSNMAIGVSKLLGIKVTRNFNHPLVARNMAEYWRRWHMSLTNWITNYIFMPLNIRFRNMGKSGICLAVVINLVVIGLWHGANWTFALFGLYHGLLFIPLVYNGAFGKNKKLKPVEFSLGKFRMEMPGWKNFFFMLITFCLVAIGHVVFRAPDIRSAFDFFCSVADSSILQMPHFEIGSMALLLTTLMILLDWICRKYEHPLQMMAEKCSDQRWARWAVYYIIVILILRYQGTAAQFIYFQF